MTNAGYREVHGCKPGSVIYVPVLQLASQPTRSEPSRLTSTLFELELQPIARLCSHGQESERHPSQSCWDWGLPEFPLCHFRFWHGHVPEGWYRAATAQHYGSARWRWEIIPCHLTGNTGGARNIIPRPWSESLSDVPYFKKVKILSF